MILSKIYGGVQNSTADRQYEISTHFPCVKIIFRLYYDKKSYLKDTTLCCPDIVIKYISGEPVKAPYFVDFHIHDCREIVCYKRGIGISKIANTQVYYTANSYVMIPLRVRHAEESITDNNFIFCLGFEMQDSEIQLFHETLFLDTKNKDILLLLEKILSEISQAKTYYRDIASASIAEILIKTQRNISSSNKTLADERISLIKEYIKTHLFYLIKNGLSQDDSILATALIIC